MNLRFVIADDEAPPREWLKQQLKALMPEAAIVAEVSDGEQALSAIETLRPDVALLDIRMPVLSGLDVASRLAEGGKWSGRIVFVTAFDEFAVDAFDRAAVDYLLKPVAPERLARCLERLRRPPEDDAIERLRALLAAAGTPAPPPLRWLRVEVGEAVQLVDVGTVDGFVAADKYTLARVGAREYLLRTSLRELESELDPERFWRIHRGTLVRVDAIDRVRRDLMGRYWIELKSGGAALAVSRAHAQRFRPM